MYFRADIRSLYFTTVCLVSLFLSWFVKPTGYSSLLWVLGSAALCFITCVINHNHMHYRIFRDSKANFLLEILLTACRGHTSATVYVPHNMNHHLYQGNNRDWITPNHVNHKRDLASTVTYIFLSILRMNIERRNDKSPVPTTIRHQKNLQRVFLYFLLAVLLSIDIGSTLYFIVLPWTLGACLLVGANLYQHAGCDSKHIYASSRNFENRFENWIFFNNGLHTAHHIYPGVHWSELPKIHANIRAKIPDDLNQGSMLFYALRYAFPNREEKHAHSYIKS